MKSRGQHEQALKDAAHQLRKATGPESNPMKMSHAYEAVAQKLGFANWNACLADAKRKDESGRRS